MTLTEIRREARLTMDLHGLQTWAFAFDRSVKRFGSCNYTKRTISLSRALVQRTSIEKVRDTILHEIAHAKVGPGHGHNFVWRSVARSIGCNGQRCYDSSEVTPVPGKWQAVCPNCERRFHRFRAVRPGAQHFCTRCGKVKGVVTYTRVR